MKLILSETIKTKLAGKNPPISRCDIEQCFATRDCGFLEDDREKNRTTPPTWWFISDTFMGLRIKVVFIRLQDGSIVIKTAYIPNQTEINIYTKYAKAIT